MGPLGSRGCQSPGDVAIADSGPGLDGAGLGSMVWDILYTLALKGFLYPYFEAYVATI